MITCSPDKLRLHPNSSIFNQYSNFSTYRHVSQVRVRNGKRFVFKPKAFLRFFTLNQEARILSITPGLWDFHAFWLDKVIFWQWLGNLSWLSELLTWRKLSFHCQISLPTRSFDHLQPLFPPSIKSLTTYTFKKNNNRIPKPSYF